MLLVLYWVLLALLYSTQGSLVCSLFLPSQELAGLSTYLSIVHRARRIRSIYIHTYHCEYQIHIHYPLNHTEYATWYLVPRNPFIVLITYTYTYPIPIYPIIIATALHCTALYSDNSNDMVLHYSSRSIKQGKARQDRIRPRPGPSTNMFLSFVLVCFFSVYGPACCDGISSGRVRGSDGWISSWRRNERWRSRSRLQGLRLY